jgi:hypothetical protein
MSGQAASSGPCTRIAVKSRGGKVKLTHYRSRRHDAYLHWIDLQRVHRPEPGERHHSARLAQRQVAVDFRVGPADTVGWGWQPQTGELWGVDNGIGALGDNLVIAEQIRPAVAFSFSIRFNSSGRQG